MSSVRSVHSFLAFVGGSFLLLTIVTGVLYSVCSSFYKHDQIKFLLQLHQMSILGISKFYVPVLGVYVLGQVSLGAVLSYRRLQNLGFSARLFFPQVWTWRCVHSVSVMLGSVLLALMAISGTMHRVLKSWVGLKTHFWMDLHVGKVFAEGPLLSFLGFQYWPWYPLTVGLICLLAVLSGFLLVNFRKRFDLAS